jgi:hypothetical protein
LTIDNLQVSHLESSAVWFSDLVEDEENAHLTLRKEPKLILGCGEAPHDPDGYNPSRMCHGID